MLSITYNEGRQVLEVWKDGQDDHPLEQYVWDGRYVHSPCLRWRDGNCDGAHTGACEKQFSYRTPWRASPSRVGVWTSLLP
jgi:hypothetical protein